MKRTSKLFLAGLAAAAAVACNPTTGGLKMESFEKADSTTTAHLSAKLAFLLSVMIGTMRWGMEAYHVNSTDFGSTMIEENVVAAAGVRFRLSEAEIRRLVTDAGFPIATARLYALDGASVMIGRVVVLPEYRHMGIGTMVVRACEAWAKELGFEKVVVESRENKIPFYEQLGYLADLSQKIVGDTFTCYRMEKSL